MPTNKVLCSRTGRVEQGGLLAQDFASALKYVAVDMRGEWNA